MEPVGVDVVFLTSSGSEAESLSGLLAPASVRVHAASSLVEAEGLMAATQARVLVAETSFRDGTWQDALQAVARGAPDAVLVVCGADADDRLWAEAINCGAFDVLVKPFHGPEVCRILTSAFAYAERRPTRPLAAAS